MAATHFVFFTFFRISVGNCRRTSFCGIIASFAGQCGLTFLRCKEKLR